VCGPAVSGKPGVRTGRIFQNEKQNDHRDYQEGGHVNADADKPEVHNQQQQTVTESRAPVLDIYKSQPEDGHYQHHRQAVHLGFDRVIPVGQSKSDEKRAGRAPSVDEQTGSASLSAIKP